MASKEYYENISSNISKDPDYFKKILYGGKNNLSTLIEPRTRDNNFAHALSFEVFDPLWMLARQWQYGRFEANDCGTPVTVKVKTVKKRIDHFYLYNPNKIQKKRKYSNEIPIECNVEKETRSITIVDSVESALRVKKKLQRLNIPDYKVVINSLIDYFYLDNPIPYFKSDIEDLKTACNDELKQYYNAYKDKIFDGYKLYQALMDNDENTPYIKNDIIKSVYDEFVNWFKSKYFSCDQSHEAWNMEKMSYATKVDSGKDKFIADDYESGKMSWYSFDHDEEKTGKDEKEIKMLSYIPTPANIPGAPSLRLWGIENIPVIMGCQTNGFSTMANAVVMQYINNYSNDWMITPLETETGVVLDVEGIVIKDTFGESIYITADAEKADYKYFKNKEKMSASQVDELRFTDRWNMFGNTKHNAYLENNFSVNRGLFFPSSLIHNEERVLEEVQFLRDEMANMVWGVETIVPNMLGGTINGDELSNKVLSSIKSEKDVEENSGIENPESSNLVDVEDKEKEEPKYSYLMQNSVPLNWIPFTPQHINGSNREMQLRRGKMPLFYNDAYLPVRPSTRLLAGNSSFNEHHIVPMVINEEEVTAYGIKLTKTMQRTRWMLGKSINWVGNKKSISCYPYNSGLMFDELIEKTSGKAISLTHKKEIDK